MTLYEFIALTDGEQANAVWNGTFLDIRTDRNCKVLLYDLGNFYVEVTYSPSIKEITRLRPFKTTALLQPYLDQMESKELDELI
jgi:hypothetical protein